jgi:succinate dehydrogenase/fumarate reductase cytochrome b subunit
MNRKQHVRRRAPVKPAGWGRRPRVDLTRLVSYATHVLSRLTLLGGFAGTALAVLSTAAYAAPAPDPAPGGPDSIEAVVGNIRTWLVGILVAVATLFLTIGGLRLMWANGDPGEAEKGKAALKSAAVGYGLAMLAPLIVTIVGTWVS